MVNSMQIYLKAGSKTVEPGPSGLEVGPEVT